MHGSGLTVYPRLQESNGVHDTMLPSAIHYATFHSFAYTHRFIAPLTIILAIKDLTLHYIYNRRAKTLDIISTFFAIGQNP